MHSWKYKKLKDEQRKARRRGKQRFARSVCFVDAPPRKSPKTAILKLGFFEKLRRKFQRRIIRKNK